MIEFLSISGFLEALNPLAHASQAEYSGFWAMMFNTILSGFWARLFAASFLILAFWFGVYRRLFSLGILFFAMSVVLTYLGGVIGMMFWWAS
ncbi:MAG: hypothetical protein M0P16_00305 [Syntrophales bacterium]|nr:hypothetical protein [Syntrophales bacterium]